MFGKVFSSIYDWRRSATWANRLRNKRFDFLRSLIDETQAIDKLKILDVGGTPLFWEKCGFSKQELAQMQIIFLNIEEVECSNFEFILGDAKNMTQFKENDFDLVVSNSVIEHVGDYDCQHQMAEEIKRVGKRYFIQTPNLYFPVEPHFLVPFFQFFPNSLRVWLLTHFSLGWYAKIDDIQQAKKLATETQLLSKKKFTNLFNEASIYEEKVLAITKSFIAYNGWERNEDNAI